MFSLLKPNVTLAISNQGIGLQQSGKIAQMLTHADFKATDFKLTDEQQLHSILAANQSLIEGKTLQIVLSNTFVRYLVLPWQAGIFHQQDWQAIAQHAFRQQYGPIVDEWRIKVRLQLHGQNVLAAAIDETLCEQLDTCAKQLNLRINSITPLLLVLSEQSELVDNTWMLVAEPARLTLCQIKQGNWQQVLVDVPAANQEYQQAEQLINRNLMHVPLAEQPSKIATYVSASLNRNWRDDMSSRQKLMQHASSVMPHAAWLASLTVPANSLNFASKPYKRPSLWAWLLLLLSLIIWVFLWQQYQHLKTAVNDTQASLLNAQLQPINATTISSQRAQQANVAQASQFAYKTQQHLNTPWLTMLGALESVKSNNPHIELTEISPNKDRAEIKLKGEASAFTDITQLLNDLRTNPAFSDAVLLSQHVEQEAANLIYVFELNVGWR